MPSNDRKRFSNAIIAAVIFVLIYSFFFKKSPQKPVDNSSTGKPAATATEKSGDKAPKINPKDIGGPVDKVRLLHIRTAELSVILSSHGAGIEKLELLNHHPSASEQDKPLLLLDKNILNLQRKESKDAGQTPSFPTNLPVRSSMVLAYFRDGTDFENWNWKLRSINGQPASSDANSLQEIDLTKSKETTLSIGFIARRGPIEVEKTFTFKSSGFDVDLEVLVTNRSQEKARIDYHVIGAAGLKLDEPANRYTRLTTVLAGRGAPLDSMDKTTIDIVSAGKYTREGTRQNLVLSRGCTEWATLRGRYFAATLMPKNPQEAIMAFAESLDPRVEDKVEHMNMAIGIKVKDFPLEPNKSATRAFRLRVGPHKVSDLENYSYVYQGQTINRDLASSVDFSWSWFAWLSRLLLKLIRLCYTLVPNWGWCIVIVTLLVKLLLHPLSVKGQKTMQMAQEDMQRIQPKIENLKKQYKGEPAKLHQAQAKLFKDENVNPAAAMGGCLPMLLQMPIFIGLYGAIRGAFEFRQAGFLWIHDLSRPDATFSLPFWPGDFNVLPIVYGVLMLIQMSMQPLPKEGQQRQTALMMRFMPLMFLFIFYSMPSAFVLYFTASALIGIVESRITKSQLQQAKEARAATAATAGTDSGKDFSSPPKSTHSADPAAFWQSENEKKQKKKK